MISAFYKAVVSESLARGSSEVECTLDAEMIVKSIASTLRRASVTSCPEPKKRKSKIGFPKMESLQVFMGAR